MSCLENAGSADSLKIVRPGPTDQILVYFGVESVDTYIGRIQDLGGRILQPKMAIPNVGYIAVAADPEGNVFALFQGDESAA